MIITLDRLEQKWLDRSGVTPQVLEYESIPKIKQKQTAPTYDYEVGVLVIGLDLKMSSRMMKNMNLLR